MSSPRLEDYTTPNPWSFTFKFSMLEIYNESVKDLLVGVTSIDDAFVSSGNAESSAGGSV